MLSSYQAIESEAGGHSQMPHAGRDFLPDLGTEILHGGTLWSCLRLYKIITLIDEYVYQNPHG